jgi:hypothetical protein
MSTYAEIFGIKPFDPNEDVEFSKKCIIERFQAEYPGHSTDHLYSLFSTLPDYEIRKTAYAVRNFGIKNLLDMPKRVRRLFL